MSIPRITGQQARDLLDGITEGPWEFFHDEWGHDDDGEARFEQWGVIGGSDGIMSASPRDSLFGADNGLVDDHDHAANLTLAAAAPALAETVAWLYERIAEIHNDQRCWADAYRAPIPDDPWSILPERAARAEAHDDCADMLQTLLDDEEARP